MSTKCLHFFSELGMGTTAYFSKTVIDDLDKSDSIELEIGTTSYKGDGPQMYIKFGDQTFLLSHQDAKELTEGVERVASYFGQWPELRK
jgi:hypothetical protein